MTHDSTQSNVDSQEIHKFNQLANDWWNVHGECAPLHALNPLRLSFIQKHIDLKNKKVLDVGCGGGILAESLAKQGAHVTGIDLAESALQAAKDHQKLENLDINYRLISVEELAHEHPHSFDVITCMEMLEHVPDPSAVISACSRLLKPGGAAFFSTINRNPKAYLLGIIGAEYILNLLPKGTHEYAKFIRPSELANSAREADLQLHELMGITYHPLTKQYKLSSDVSVNYLVYTSKV